MIRPLFYLLAVVCGFLIGGQNASAGEPASYRQAALTLKERRILNQKAERGDDKAAFALALYYKAVAPNLKNREYFLILASKSGSRESIEALADFYSMPRGLFRLQKAISLRKELKSRFPSEVDNISWAEGCAFEYQSLTNGEARRRELAFLKLAASWGSLRAQEALQKLEQERPSRDDSAEDRETNSISGALSFAQTASEQTPYKQTSDAESLEQKISHRPEASHDAAKPEKQAAFSGSRASFVLFSWKDRGDYRFALVPVEKEAGFLITFHPRRVGIRGLTKLKTALEKLSAGTSIVWEDDAIKGLTYPSIDYIDQITTFARSKGLDIELNPVVVE